MENNNSQPPAPVAPAKVTAPANEPPKTTQASSNHEVVPMAARTATTDGSAAEPQRGTGTGSMFGTTAQRGASMPRSPTAVGSRACRPVQQTNPVVFGQGSSSINLAKRSSSTQAAAATALAAATHGPTAQHGAGEPWGLPPAAVLPPRKRPKKKLMIKRPSSPPPPELPVVRPPRPPRTELGSSSAAGNALLPSSSDAGFCVSNMQADPPPSPGQVAVAEEGTDSKGGGGSRNDVKMLDLNFPPDSDEEN